MNDGAFRVIVLPKALADLDLLVSYIKTQSPQNAEATFDRLWEATQSLSQFPKRYKLHRRGRPGKPAVRSMPVSSFVIYYSVIDEPPTVRVLAIRRGARLPPRQFE